MTSVKTSISPAPAPLNRLPSTVLPLTDRTPSFVIDAKNKSFKHQYANIYFVRLRVLRAFVEKEAKRRWKDVRDSPKLVSRVLDVVKGELCYIVGTVYMEMPLKPNVLADIGRDRSIPAPPPRDKICSPEDSVMIEDESGRMHLVGEPLKKAHLVTGIIVGALGMENSSGEFSVVDLCFAGLAPQEEDEGGGDVMDVDTDSPEEYVGIISGLDIGPNPSSDAQIQMMVEYLTGEGGGSDDQVSASQISRLIIAGNSLAPIGGSGIDEEAEKERKPRRYGYDYASFSPHPTLNLSAHLLDLSRSIPIHLLPGTSDPSGTILPQQPLPRAMFGEASSYSSFNCETNPTYIRFETGISESSAPDDNGASSSKRALSSTGPTYTRTILATSGQPTNDMFKYLPTPPTTRLGLSESTLRWRHMAPTAPDTLWCHPYFTVDPFVINQTPDIYIIGDQPRFTSKLVKEGNKRCRIVLVPSFAETGVLVLVGLRTLNAKIVKFSVEKNMTLIGNETS